MRIREGQIWQSKITGGKVEVMYQAVPQWVGVKLLDLKMADPYVEIATKAFGVNLTLIQDV